MSYVAHSNPFACEPITPKAAVDILPCSTFYSLCEEQFIERVHLDISTFVSQKSSGWTACFVSVLPFSSVFSDN